MREKLSTARMLFLFGLFFVACGLHFAKTAEAHLAGQPPFFKINGVFTNVYPVSESKNTTAFTFPQDIGASSYVVNEPLLFSLNEATLPYPTGYLSQLVFEWDFGDKTKGTGIQNTHSYKTSGTYEVTVTSKIPGSDESFLLQNTYVQIKPSKNYTIPKPVILINGKSAKEYPLEFAQTDLRRPVVLAVELPKGSEIKSYIWDLDDGTKQTEKSFTHTFPSSRSVVTPVLRVVDKYGLIIDVSEPIVNKKTKDNLLLPSITAAVLAVIAVIAVIVIMRKQRKK